MGLVAPRHVGSSQTRARTCVPCTGRRILNHCATREVPSFLFMANLPLYGYTTVCLCNRQLRDVWIGFHFLAILNNAAINIHVQVFVQMYIFIFLEHFLGAGLPDHMVTPCLTFRRTAKLFSKVDAPFYIPGSNV